MAQREGIVERRMNGNGKAWEWFWRFLSILAIPWAMWISVMLVDVRERVAVIEGNRFSSSDGLEVWRALNEKADADDVPPRWFLERVDHLEDEVDELQKERN